MFATSTLSLSYWFSPYCNSDVSKYGTSITVTNLEFKQNRFTLGQQDVVYTNALFLDVTCCFVSLLSDLAHETWNGATLIQELVRTCTG